MEFEIRKTVYVEIEEVGDRLGNWLGDVLRDDLGFEDEEIRAIDEDAVLKAVARYWLDNLD